MPVRASWSSAAAAEQACSLPLPGVSDVSAIDKDAMFAVTGAPDRKLYLVSTDGTVQEIADPARMRTR